jgi:hypothetical protein
MRTVVTSDVAEVVWEDGVITSDTPQVAEMIASFRGEAHGGPPWGGVEEADTSKHRDFLVVALDVLGTDAKVDGDLPDLGEYDPDRVYG